MGGVLRRAEAVLGPLGMERTVLDGSPAHAAESCVGDLIALGRELLAPTLVVTSTLAEATREQFPDLRDTLPGVGSVDRTREASGSRRAVTRSRIGRGVATGPERSPTSATPAPSVSRPDAGPAAVALTDRRFGRWALEAWPPSSDAVLAGMRSHPPG